MEPKTSTNAVNLKIKSKVRNLNIIAVILLVIQVLGYISSMKNIDVETPSRNVGFYIGYNFWIVLSLFFFMRAANLKKKLSENDNNTIPNSILIL